ncbi:hypothetical protein B9Z55_017336 [Caenorhabditis nigoni]|uniref:DUF7809 domain-containing protein n=1 Tax=Caenorhabditis nigoni TaxID=1611254 RepID=A0A2G5T9A7_9PELO|nr:hypothetical protein B9Z55_017336 [Caenorhabditis nigoni]
MNKVPISYTNPLGDKRFLLNHKRPGHGPIFYAFLHEDHHDIVNYSSGDFCIHNESKNLDYYGGAGTLFTQVEQFRNFPGNLDFFETDLSTPYLTRAWPKFYMSMKNQKKVYIYKQDLLSMMQMQLMKNLEPQAHTDFALIANILGIYLRTKEEMMDGKFEFAPYDETKMNEFGKKVGGRFKFAMERRETYTSNQLNDKKTVEEVSRRLKNILPPNHRDPEYVGLDQLLTRLNEDNPVEKNHQRYEYIITLTKVVVGEFNTFINANKSWFLPIPVDQNPRIAYVRVLQEPKGSYLFGFELLKEMRRCGMNTEVLEEKLREKRDNYCLEIEEVRSLIKDKNIELILTLVTASPIKEPIWMPAPGGKFCIPSTDFVQSLIARIHNTGYFQKATVEMRDKLIEEFALLKQVLEDAKIGYRDITASETKQVKKQILDDLYRNDVEPISLHLKQEVRQKPNGQWTTEDLESEIRHLGLDVPFPNIFSIVQNIIKWKPDFHSVTDLFTAVEVSMFYCVIKEAGIAEYYLEDADGWYARVEPPETAKVLESLRRLGTTEASETTKALKATEPRKTRAEPSEAKNEPLEKI